MEGDGSVALRLLKTALRGAVKGIVESRFWMGISRLVDTTVAMLLRGHVRTRARVRGAVVLATVGQGNIGDQAMLDAVLASMDGRVTVVLSRPDALRIASEQHGLEVDVLVLPTLVDGWPVGRLRARWRLGKCLREACNFIVIGADILDGTYDLREALIRCDLVRFAHRLGCASHVVGFSWSPQAHPRAAAALERISGLARLCVRDELSLARLEAYGCRGLQLVADVVFTLAPQPTSPNACTTWIESQRGAGLPVVLFNTSGLLNSRHGLIEGYIATVRALLNDGCAVVLLPHVVRPGDDDLSCSTEVFRSLEGESSALYLVSELYTPQQVIGVAASVNVTVTGRMHLAILSLNAGTPAITMSSQGKVEGLMRLVGTPQFVVDPTRDLPHQVVPLVRQVLSFCDVESIPSVSIDRAQRLGRLNFPWLTARDVLRVLLLTPYSHLRTHDHAANDLAVHLYPALAKHVELHVYAPDNPTDADRPDAYGVFVHGPHLADSGRGPLAIWQRAGIYPTRLRGDWRRSDTARALEIVRQVHPDHVHVEYLQPAEALLRLADLHSTSVTLHDVTTWVVQEEIRQSRGLRRAYRRLDAYRLARIEKAVVRRSSATLAFSARDVSALRSMGARRTTVVRFGVDLPDRTWWPPADAATPVLVFAGAMWREANILTARYLIEQVMPEVWRILPAARLRIVGARPPEALQSAMSLDERLILTGAVPDFDPEFLGAHVVLAPTIVRAGVLLKALRSMSLACPVILNEAAAAPLEGAQPGREYILAATPVDYAHAVRDLTSDPVYAARVGRAAREYVRASYSWDECAANYTQVFVSSARRRRGYRA